MVAQLRDPRQPMPCLMPVDMPADDMHTAYGYSRGESHEWLLNSTGQEAAAIAQRVLLMYVLQMATRAELAKQFGYRPEAIQNIVSGRAHDRFTAPIRRRLMALAIGCDTMRRSHERVREVLRALLRLSFVASAMLVMPEKFSAEYRREVALDLYLLSGAWREDRA